MTITIIFALATLICFVFFVLSIRRSRKNPGYTVTTGLLILMNLVCIGIVNCDSVRSAGKLFLAYYLVQGWMFLSTFWTVKNMFYKRAFDAYSVFFLLTAALGTSEVVLCFNTPRILAFDREIFFGKLWWIAHDMIQGPPRPISIRAFGIICTISSLVMITFLGRCVLGTQKIFRAKFHALTCMQVLLVVGGIVCSLNLWPVWLLTMVMNAVCYLTFYYVFDYSGIKLRDTTIEYFADEMSDGLIIYDMYNELIHTNNLIKTKLTEEHLEDIKSIYKLEELLSHTEKIENLEVFPYSYLDDITYFTVRKRTIGEGKNFVGTVFILHDSSNSINQIRMMEEVNNELEQAARMKSDFLANMSHELRTPMNAVIGLTQIALKEDLPVRAKDCLKQISNSGRNLLNIINDILDYSKIEAGKMEIFPDVYEPCSEIYDVANILQSRIGDKDIQLVMIVDEKLPHQLIGDCMRIRQILINLANNAIKFTEEGYVKITLDCEKISDDEIMTVYHVIDTGQGIIEADIPKLFTSFQQVNSKRNRTVEGTGLGLAISKSLCDVMGGTIGVKSEYGKGSDFWFKLPQKVKDPTPELVVEDAANKYGFCINEREHMTEPFVSELRKLGVEYRMINDYKEYRPTGKQDYLFIEDIIWTPLIEDFARTFPKLKVCVLTKFDSNIKSDLENVIFLHKPQTTLALVMMLNGKSLEYESRNDETGTHHTFEAPDARILVVDDNSVNLSIVEGLIEPLKIKCVMADSGNAALSILKRDHFDLILMDHMMPGMDGIDTTKAIRETIPDASDTPIVALTANVMEGSKAMFIESGMVDLIPKPVEVRQLYSKLHDWLPKNKIVEVGEGEDNHWGCNASNVNIYPCLESERAIRSLGSENLFKKIVGEYYKKAPEIMKGIEEAYTKKDWDNYAIRTHALKSTSRQIGAFELGSIAETLEHAGKNKDIDIINENHEKAIRIYGRLIDDLSIYFEESPESGSGEDIHEEALEEIFKKLHEACEELDMDGMESCGSELRKYTYPDDKKYIIDKILTGIDACDTEACEEGMDQYRTK